MVGHVIKRSIKVSKENRRGRKKKRGPFPAEVGFMSPIGDCYLVVVRVSSTVRYQNQIPIGFDLIII
jgi:hypothetical protein